MEPRHIPILEFMCALSSNDKIKLWDGYSLKAAYLDDIIKSLKQVYSDERGIYNAPKEKFIPLIQKAKRRFFLEVKNDIIYLRQKC
ncbi:MAG: hypothetical protein U9Q69_00045 [Nanoarchaeota archaeon]|nr:hypothetical protein [Nanoarchaeota archaeon]